MIEMKFITNKILYITEVYMPSGIYEDLTGKQFGRLTIIGRDYSRKGKVLESC